MFNGVHASTGDDDAQYNVTVAPRRAGRAEARRTSSSRSRRSEARRARAAAPTRRSSSTRSRASSSARSRPSSLHQGEPAGRDRGARDEQRRAAGANEELHRLERGAAEHERGAPERQRGALHGQRRVPAQDRRAHRADQRHGQPAREHRRRHDLPRRAAAIRKFTPQIAETLQPVPHDVGRSIETFAHTTRSPRARRRTSRRVLATRRARRARGARRSGRAVLPAHPAVPREGRASTGVVLTLIDVSGLKAAEDALFHERYLLEQPALQRARRDLLQGRARQVHPREPGRWRARLGLDDPARRRRQDGVRAARPASARSRSTSRTRRCCERASRSTTSSRSGAAATAQREWDLVTRLPLRRSRSSAIVGIIGIFRDVTRAEARRGEDPGGRAPARPVPRDALARAPQSARRRSSRATALLKADGDAGRSATRLVEILERQSAADGAPARRPARGEPRHAEQDRAAQAARRSARRRRARRPTAARTADGRAQASSWPPRSTTVASARRRRSARACSRSTSTC